MNRGFTEMEKKMSKIAVITDSNAHITPQEAEKLGISVVPMPFMIGDETFYEGITLSRDSCQSARMLADDYDGKVQVVNNQRISVTQKRSVLDALEMAEMGMSAAQIREELEHVKYESSIYIMLDTLYYLKKGGRITPAAAAVGTLLRIKPVLQIKGERLDAFSKARTMNQGKNIMINAMKHDIETLYGGTDKENVWLYAVQGNVPDQFAEFSQEVRAAFPAFKVQDDVLSLSIACHIGPGALAIACSKKIPLHKES